MGRAISPRTKVWALCAAMLSSVAACGGDRTGPVQPDALPAVDPLRALPRAITSEERASIAASNGFALRLLQAASRGERANVFDRFFVEPDERALAFLRHRVALDVDEVGTKAAAGTVVFTGIIRDARA